MPTRKIETGVTRQQILSELVKSPHGKLNEYLTMGQTAAAQEPEFLAHLISWNRLKGQVRDSKVALPVIPLQVPAFIRNHEFVSNSLAHLSLLGPRELLRAYRFAKEIKTPGFGLQLKRLVTNWLQGSERNKSKWDRLAIQHRHTLKELYALTHSDMKGRTRDILFFGKLPEGSVFETVAKLKDMAPIEAAGAIITQRIPFLIASGALGEKLKSPDLVLALIKRMSATELVTNTKMLEKLGVKTNPALRGVYEEALEKAASNKKNVLKTSRAVENISDEGLKAKLRGVQDKQIANIGIDGDWAVLVDKSGSMNYAIKTGAEVAAVLAKFVKGKVHLIFFDNMPRYLDVTGMTLDQIRNSTRNIAASGGTSIGCGLQSLLDSKVEVDGIAIVSDGGDNTSPFFSTVYPKYCQFVGKDTPVYLYHCQGEHDALSVEMERLGMPLQKFEVDRSSDFYSLPELVQTMRTNRYSLVQEIMDTPLLTYREKEIPDIEIVEADEELVTV